MKWLIPISLAILGGTARADQCQWLDETAAETARAILTRSPAYIEYCEPCGAKAPGAPEVAKTVEVRGAGDGYREVSVNGTAIDLAYVFVKTDAARYRNLAGLAGCPATGVSPSLDIADETPNGVLITAGNDPLPAPLPTPAVALPPPAPVVAPPQVLVYTTTARKVAWLPLALVAAGGFVTGSAFTVLLLGLRRRRAMQPRAADLSRRSE
jgi:hypothetical protein